MIKVYMSEVGTEYTIESSKSISQVVLKQFARHGVREENGVFFYTFTVTPNNSFLVKAIINTNPALFEVTEEVKRNINKQMELQVLPKVFLHDSTHVGISIPGIPYYLNVVNNLFKASPKSYNVYTVPFSRAFEVVRLLKSINSFMPAFEVSQELKDVLFKPLSSFDGSLSSLFNGDITDLYAVKNAWKTKPEDFNNAGYNSPIDFALKQPLRHIDKTQVSQASEWVKGDEVVFIGKVIEKEVINFNHAKLTFDVNGQNVSAMFYRRAWMIDKYSIGESVLVIGKYDRYYRNAYNVSGSSIDSLDEANALPIVPIYSQSQKNKITTKLILNCVYELFDRLAPVTKDIAGYIQNPEEGMTLQEAMVSLHFPKDINDYKKALNVLAFYELVYMQLLFLHKKATEVKKKGLSKPHKPGGLADQAINGLPFTLTDEQKKALRDLDKIMTTDSSEQALISADVGSGKALLSTERILTPSGWKTMKDLKVNDYVMGRDGKPTRVIGVFPQGKRPLVKLSLSDGIEKICDVDHLWSVAKGSSHNELYTTTAKHLARLNLDENSNIFLPNMTGPACFDSFDERDYYYAGKVMCRLTTGEVPEFVLLSSPNSRLSFIQGVVDTIGTIEDGDVFVKVPSSMLNDFKDLVRSLGGLVWGNDELLVRTPKGFPLSRVSSNSINYAPLERKIIGVELLDREEETICIKVSAKDELFICDSYVVTHNTIVAQLSCLQAVDNGYQAVLAAPTEVLAEQLYKTFVSVLDGIPAENRPSIVYLSGAVKAAEKRAIYKSIAFGEVDLIVGTHSVLNSNVPYKNLGVVLIDEQQKFGTAQRESLLNIRDDGFMPDIISQTATPIPRSTAQVFYGDINLVTIGQKPKGRLPIITEWIKEDPRQIVKDKKNPLWADLSNEMDEGHKVFFVVPMVQENEKMNVASVKEGYADLQKLFPNQTVEFVHGQMKKNEQLKHIENFRSGDSNILIASTVIEVGVDIPLATRMVILSADRLGASSLHQIRGRVGRNSLQSKCYLVSNNEKANNTARLGSLVDSNDGFKIATVDLTTRGEGDLFGTTQSGSTSLMFANLVDHSKHIDRARSLAEEIYKSPRRLEAIMDAEAILKRGE